MKDVKSDMVTQRGANAEQAEAHLLQHYVLDPSSTSLRVISHLMSTMFQSLGLRGRLWCLDPKVEHISWLQRR